MRLTVNGKATDIESGVTLQKLLEQYDISNVQKGIAVAVNSTVVPRESWGETALRDGDSIEIIHAVQGG
ncbi:MAG: sulfur carrier protein ThiS [Candidatus Latescibacteria bacterium]|nr:sulfur carrier protein ThiS [Candidatus Latescibacterota bacterium]NIM21801.1 sulfur carrier protein ThiS [Candidatus Latescibacterota bacterium]NIM65939.1 sulfur carrier protein ThiS [Candidatus Latescibacterota bacterium]NIO02684.1 sulfur carrier protein ThiS [Candidatus Latescibacterota bacterium]NIO29665.1 sulfur carrier protein ThiS [Candidatus Latescibacterota bacterium]